LKRVRREYPVAEENADVIEPNPVLFVLVCMFQANTVYRCRSRLGDLMTNLKMM